MNWFPVFINSEKMNCLIIGGGDIALFKLKVISEYNFNIKVVAPEVLPDIENYNCEIIKREFEEKDTDGVFLVIDATGNPQTGKKIKTICDKRNIILNSVDNIDLCDFIFPAIYNRGKLTCAISTGGASPVVAGWLKNKIGDFLPDCFDDILLQMENIRPFVKEKFPEQKKRSEIFKRCFKKAIEMGRALEEKEIEEIYSEVV